MIGEWGMGNRAWGMGHGAQGRENGHWKMGRYWGLGENTADIR